MLTAAARTNIMNVFTSIISSYKKIFDFKTRATRLEYFNFYLFVPIFLFLFAMADYYWITPFITGSRSLLLWGLIELFLIIPSFSLSVRRLHDLNLSGLYLLLCFIPIIGGGAHIILMVLCLFMKGTENENKYG